MSTPNRPSAPRDATVPWFSTAGKIQPHAEKPRPLAEPQPRLRLRTRDLLLAFCGLPLAICMLGEFPRVHPPLPHVCDCPVIRVDVPDHVDVQTHAPPAKTPEIETPTAPVVDIPHDAANKPSTAEQSVVKRSTSERATAKRPAKVDVFRRSAMRALRHRIRPACAKHLAPGKRASVEIHHSVDIDTGLVQGAVVVDKTGSAVERCVLAEVRASAGGKWKTSTSRRFTYTLRGRARRGS